MMTNPIESMPTDPKRQWIQEALDRYEGPLTRYAERLTGDLDRARDVVQETFLKLCTCDRERVEGGLREWLFTVTRNRALDVGKKERRMKPLADGAAEAQTCTAPAPSDLMAVREDKSRLTELLADLPPNQQEVLRLKFQEGMSYKEISAITKHTISNVGYLIHVGVKSLRHKMKVQPGFSRD